MSTNWQDLMKLAEEEGGYELLPAGDYNVVVTAAEAKKSTKGSDMIKTTFQVEDGPHKGRLVWNNYVITPSNPAAMKHFFRHMAAFGLTGSFFTLNPSHAAIAETIVNRHVTITLKASRIWEGTPQNDVVSTKPRAGGAPANGSGPVSVPNPAATPAPAPPTTAAPAPPVPPISGDKPF